MLKGLDEVKAGLEKREQLQQPRYHSAATTNGKRENTTAKQYNLMRLMTGTKPITSRDNDVLPDTDAVKYRSGSTNTEQKTASEKIRKSYELIHALTRR
jgi:hypothetical protein